MNAQTRLDLAIKQAHRWPVLLQERRRPLVIASTVTPDRDVITRIGLSAHHAEDRVRRVLVVHFLDHPASQL